MRTDVLVSTDVASKGLDFPDIQHVINFDMPKEVRRAPCRSRRSRASQPLARRLRIMCIVLGARGAAARRAWRPRSLTRTRYAVAAPSAALAAQAQRPAAQDELVLLDLKHLLMEAKQRVPPVLMALDDPRERNAGNGDCSYCGGLGHSITECPKLEESRAKISGKTRDFLAGNSGGYGGDW